MDDTSDGRDPGAHAAEDADPEETGRSSFLARFFRRETADEEDDDRSSTRQSAAELSHAQDMLVNLSNMRSLRVEDVSVPRADIVAVPEDASIADLVAVFKESTNSRLPVYRETLDQPVGLVHLKDLALKYGFNGETEDFYLAGLVRPLLYAPPSMPIGVLLHKMQTARMHMALVIDEYGGVDGLVTIEDLLEQIVGEIADEHDEDEGPLWACEAAGVYLAQARMDVSEFETVAGVQLVSPDLKEEVDTLGGLVFRLAGRVPLRGELVTHEDGHEFEILEADARRIKRMRVRLSSAGSHGPAAEAAE